MGHRRGVLLAAAFLLVSCGTASASAISVASTTIDCSQFSSSVPLAYTSQYSIPIAEANVNGVQAPQVRTGLPDWGSVSASNSLVNTASLGETTPGLVYAEGQALADGVATLTSHASAFVGRGGYFTLTTETSLQLSVPYAYQHTLSFGLPGEAAYAQAMLFLSLLVQGPQGADWTGVDGKTLNFFDQVPGSFAGSGILALDAPVLLPPGNYAFDISAFAAASATAPRPIPEPAVLLLVGLGLVASAALRRAF